MNLKRLRNVRRASSISRPMCEPLEGRRLLSAVSLTNGAGDGGITVKVDAYGHYGSASQVGGDLTYNPVGADTAKGTTYHSAVLFSAIGAYLGEGGIGSLPSVNFTSNTGTTAVSEFDLSGYHFTLTQTLSAAGTDKTTFTQTYVIRNDTGADQSFNLTRHVDGDMYFVGGLGNDFAAVSVDGRQVYEFDTASDPEASTAYFGIGSTGDSTGGWWTIQEFPYYDDIDTANGLPVADRDTNYNDLDGDRITDFGADVTVSLQDNFTLLAGATATYSTITTFGSGSPLDLINPGTFNVAQPSYTVAEDGTSVTITVSRDAGTAGAVTVDYSLEDITATAGLDFTATSGTLSFADGESSKTFVVAIADDTLVEGLELFRVRLSNATGGAVLGTTTANVLITDNDSTVQLGAATYSLREDGGALDVTVTRVGDLTNAATVDYASADGTALAGLDYTAVTGTLSFAAGETSKTISIPVTLDALPNEVTETFSLSLSNVVGTNTLVGTPVTATVSLTNLDTIAPTATVAFQDNGKKITSMTVTFDEALATALRQDPRGYTIWARGADGRLGSGKDATVKLKSVTYDTATNVATLVPKKALAFNKIYQLSLNAPFLTDTTGNKLDGNADSTGGDNRNIFFGRGTKLSYVDRDGDMVTLSVSKGGVIDLLRDFDGEAQIVSLIQDTGTSTVSGLLKKTRHSAGSTALIYSGRAGSGNFNPGVFNVTDPI